MFRLALHWQILIAMILGASVGLVLNATVGTHDSQDRAEPRWTVHDSTDRIEVKIFSLDRQGRPTPAVARHIVVDPTLDPSEIKKLTAQGVKHFPALAKFRESAECKEESAQCKKAAAESQAAYKIFRLHGRSWARWIGDCAKSLGDLFLRMLKMVSIPLIITSLITGVVGLGQADRLGKMFSRTMLYYLTTSLLAIMTGLLMVNLFQPGGEPDPTKIAEAAAADQAKGKQHDLGTVLYEQLENMIPPNPVGGVANGNFLSIIAFSILFAVFTILAGGKTAEVIGDLFQAMFEVMMRMTMAIIHLAPAGVLFMMLSVTATQGAAIFATLGLYMITVACALAFHAVITMGLILKFVARRNPLEYAKAMSPALLTAFSSASSNGTLPLTLTSVEQRAGVSNRVSSFVLPLGATINMDGTALYEVVAVLFIAQFTGHDLSLADQWVVAFTALLASVGAAGIPHAGLVIMVIVLQAVGLPTETQGLIIAVDRVLDMARTCVNVWSDSCGCAVIARFESAGAAVAPDKLAGQDNVSSSKFTSLHSGPN